MKRITKAALFAFLITALFVTAAQAQGTYTAASCNQRCKRSHQWADPYGCERRS